MRDSKEEKDLATQHDKSFDITLFCNNHFDVVSSFADTLTVKELSRLRRVSTHFNQFFKTSFNHNRSLAITRFCDSNSDIVSALADNLTVKEVSRLRRVSTCFNQFFKPNFSRRTAPTCVVEGNILSLKNSDPSQLFVIHEEIIAPRGQRYFNCSAFQLMTFLCDDDMKTEIFNLESVVNYLKDDEKKAMREKQYAQIDCGGADLIMLGHDPHTIIKKQGFKGLTFYKETFIVFKRKHEVTFPLLENPDGIACYQNKKGQKHFYYINQENQTIELLNTCQIDEEHKEEFEQFKRSFDHMEIYSGRRSNLEEHRFIEKVFKRSLVQKGILYEDKGIMYRDCRTPFNLVKACRKNLRLIDEGRRYQAHFDVWRKEVGTAQGEEIWLLHKICEINRPFYPLDKNHKSVSRDYIIEKFNGSNSKIEKVCVFEKGVVTISNFGISKSTSAIASADFSEDAMDLIAICWLIENAKANVIECKLEQMQNTTKVQRSKERSKKENSTEYAPDNPESECNLF